MRRTAVTMTALLAVAAPLTGCSLGERLQASTGNSSWSEKVTEAVSQYAFVAGLKISGDTVQASGGESPDEYAGADLGDAQSSATGVARDDLDIGRLSAKLTTVGQACHDEIDGLMVLTRGGQSFASLGCADGTERRVWFGETEVPTLDTWLSKDGIEALLALPGTLLPGRDLEVMEVEATQAKVVTENLMPACQSVAITVRLVDGHPEPVDGGCSTTLGDGGSTRLADDAGPQAVAQIEKTLKKQKMGSLGEVESLMFGYLTTAKKVRGFTLRSAGKQDFAPLDQEHAKAMTKATGANRKPVIGKPWPVTLPGGWTIEPDHADKIAAYDFYAYRRGASTVYVTVASSSWDNDYRTALKGLRDPQRRGEARCGQELDTGFDLPQCVISGRDRTAITAFKNYNYPATMDEVAEVANAFYRALR